MTKCRKCGWKKGDPGDICNEGHGMYYRNDCHDYNESKPRLTLGFIMVFVAYCAIIIALQQYAATGEVDPKTNVNERLMASLAGSFFATFCLLPTWYACGGRQAADEMDSGCLTFFVFIIAAMFIAFMS